MADISVSFCCFSKSIVILYIKSFENYASFMETDSFDLINIFLYIILKVSSHLRVLERIFMRYFYLLLQAVQPRGQCLALSIGLKLTIKEASVFFCLSPDLNCFIVFKFLSLLESENIFILFLFLLSLLLLDFFWVYLDGSHFYPFIHNPS